MATSENTTQPSSDIQKWIADWRDRGFTGTSCTDSGAQFASPKRGGSALYGPVHPAFKVMDAASPESTSPSQERWKEVSRSWVFHCKVCDHPVKHRVASTPTRAQEEEFKRQHFPRNCPKSGHYVPPVSRDTPTRDLVASLSELHLRKKFTSSSQMGREETEEVVNAPPSFDREMSVFEITDEDQITKIRMDIRHNELRKVSLPYNQAQISILRNVVGGATLLGSVYFFVTKGTHLPENAGPILVRIGKHVVRAGSIIPEKLKPLVDSVAERIVSSAAELAGSDTTASIVTQIIEQLDRIGASLPEGLVARVNEDLA